MNINEIKEKTQEKYHWREKQEATTRNLDPVIVNLPYTPMTITTGCQRLEIWKCDSRSTLHTYKISTGCHIVHLDHQNAKVLSSKLNPFGLCEIKWFL